MAYSYPLLKKVIGHYGKSTKASDYYLVCCQHFLEPILKMMEALVAFGFDPKKIIMLGKTYSTNEGIRQEIANLGITALQPAFSGIAFDDEHKNNCRQLLKLVPGDATSIVLDDGGELIKAFMESDKKVFFAVEQTSSGFRKLEHETIPFPTVNVARSATKLLLESPLVARMCLERIQDYLKDKNIANPSMLVVGLGPIGENILEVFQQYGFTMRGFDTKHGHEDLLGVIKEMRPDVVIGATGSHILEKDEVEELISEKSIHFISVSSSDREFPVVPFRSPNNIHDDVAYKNIVFVNNGFPITFKGNRTELAPIEIEKTMCLLGGAVAYGVIKPYQENGIIRVPADLEDLINS